jgi:DNA polymerase
MSFEISIKSNPITQELVDEEFENLNLFVESEQPDSEIEYQAERASYFQELLEVRKSVLECKSCALRKLSRCTPVPLQGRAFKPTIIALGEAPGENEAKHGIGFCGKSGILLRASAEKVKVKVEDYVNVVACRPPSNRTPTAPEIKACSDNLSNQIKSLSPFIVLCFGGTALTTAADNKNLRITKDHGVFFKTIWTDEDKTPIWGFGMLHPSYILRAITTIQTGNPNDPEAAREIERAKLSIRKWGENWEYIGQVFQLRELFDAKLIYTYGEDLRRKASEWTHEHLSVLMDYSMTNSISKEFKDSKQIYLDKMDSKFEPASWGIGGYTNDEINVDELPF